MINADRERLLRGKISLIFVACQVANAAKTVLKKGNARCCFCKTKPRVDSEAFKVQVLFEV